MGGNDGSPEGEEGMAVEGEMEALQDQHEEEMYLQQQ